ncbi:L-fuculose phosphate aldolase [bioreactor metagenome]|uniref:L-fuculose phosphate aldolase n=1 Tax=bioreactor metagenome TaxID=1076179 RepID=A0A645DQE3_9ZZZZ
MDYFSILPEDVVIMDLQANIVDGARKPSTEFEMHRIFYEKRPDISAVIHAHTEYATVLACMRWDLPAVHYLIALAGKDVRCAKYATFGTPEIARNALEAMQDRYACLLANHGLIAGGKDLANVFKKAEEIEYCCQIYCRAKALGDPVILSEEEMEKHLQLFKTYGNADIPK